MAARNHIDAMVSSAVRAIRKGDRERSKRCRHLVGHLLDALNTLPHVVGARPDPRDKGSTVRSSVLVLTDDLDGHAYQVTVWELPGIVPHGDREWRWYEDAKQGGA